MGRVVLAVAQQALLAPLGAERLLLGVREPGGRFTVVTTDASNGPAAGRPQFAWSKAAPIFAALRSQGVGGPGIVGDCDGRILFRYAMAVPGSSEEIVAGVILDEEPADTNAVRAAVGSAVYSLLRISDADIPDASVIVSLESDSDGSAASVSLLADNDLRTVRRTGPSSAHSTATATLDARSPGMRLRFADQVAVDGEAVSLVVVDAPGVGAVIGASNMSSPGTIAPALAVMKAVNWAERDRAMTTDRVSVEASLTARLSA